jgi:pimeloyl-ACP methyl ester carboxylesterase
VRYVRVVGRGLLALLTVAVLTAVQAATVLGVLAVGGASDVAVWSSFVVIAVLCVGLAATLEALRRRRGSADSVQAPSVRSRSWWRALLMPCALWVATSLLSLTTFLRLDVAPMASPERDGGSAPTIDVRTTGTPEASENPIVVVHGGPGVPLSPFEEAAVEQLGRDLTVVVYDQAGTGRSDPLAHPRDHTLRHAVEELAHVAAATGADQVDLLGYSWGASVATAFAVEHPDRVGRLALISPGAIPWRGRAADPVGPQDRLEPLQRVGAYLLALSPRNFFVYALTAIDPEVTRWFASDDELDARFLGLYESTAAGLHCEASQIQPPPHHLGYFASQIPQLHPDLSGITEAEAEASAGDIPMLVVRGECDYIPKAVAEEYVDVFGAEHVPIAGAGHALLEDRRDRVLEKLAEFFR